MKLKTRQTKATLNSKKSTAKFKVASVNLLFCETRKPTANIPPRNQKVTATTRLFVTNKLKTITLDSGVEMSNSLAFPFSSNDLVNLKLKKYHGWNTTAIDITVIDNVGKEIEISSQVDNQYVEIDLTRCTISGNWTLLVEK
jgi:hypothetical protein